MAHTMNDVAKLAGVSATTVSRVLSHNPHISAETSKRVLAAVEKLRYYRNVHARRLAIGRSDLFGLVISEIANPYFSEIIRGFQFAAWDRGFDVLLLNTEYSEKRVQSSIRKLIENNVRGVAIMTSSLDQKIIQSLTGEGIAVVLSNIQAADRLVSNITIDYKRGLLQAIEHAVALGHRHAALIAGPSTNRTASEIRQFLIEGLKRKGLAPGPVVCSDYNLEAAAAAVKVILEAKHLPTVIFCGSDLIAMGAITALEAAQVKIPQDVSVVGIDDISFALLARPPLTTIRVPREQLGMMAFEALDKILKLKRRKGAEYVVATDLVVRKSTAQARKTQLQRKADRASNHKTKL